MDKNYAKSLEKQGYRVVGNHSAVKICNWTRNALNGKGSCYKCKFYGIRSHRCIQMTTSMSCANRCIICWRGDKAPVSKKWKGKIDNPKNILTDSIKAQINLLQGFKGNKNINKNLLIEMENPKHAALSLIGEPITYPKINELVNLMHKKRISTFVVTNAQFPKAIKKLKSATQLYVSVDAPNKVLLKKIDKPLFPDFWQRLNKSLNELSKKKFRTCIRLTIVKGINDVDLKGYSNLIRKGNPDFIEAKAFMRLGPSRKLFVWDNMPNHEYVKNFAKRLNKYLPKYEFAAEHKPSSVVLLMKKSLKKKRFIDFEKFFEIANKNKIPETKRYSALKMAKVP
ncbi:4-demethylwyosine synthase TYW1 [Candidatus Woesearchaeota archaeon]|nr:4-demethylwyosine synthase TYW1 [Candidatus Woesearchaeota archaeon]